jgi:acetolactate synthase-1/3 small subunit
VERELALVTIKGNKRVEEVAKTFEARLVSAAGENCVFEITGTSKKVDDFIEVMRPLGIVEMARSGVVAIAGNKRK